jgi:hypothetical protein
MFFIHGGGFSGGIGNLFSPQLVAEGVVLV